MQQTLFQNLQSVAIMEDGKLRPKTEDTYKYSIKIIHRLFDDKPMQEYELAEIQSIFNLMAEAEYSRSQIHQVRVLLNKAYVYNNNKLKIGWNPIPSTFVPPNAPQKEINALTVKEQKKIETACYSDMYGDFFLFLLYSGLRSEEFRNVKWEDYNSKTGILNIPKSKTTAGVRAIPLLPICQNIIDFRPHGNEYIFNSQSGNQVTIAVLRKTYLRLRQETGVNTLTNHVCRHTFATRLIEKGISIKAISSLLGHSSSTFTMDRYVSGQLPFLQNELAEFERKFDCKLKYRSTMPEEIDGQLTLCGA